MGCFSSKKNNKISPYAQSIFFGDNIDTLDKAKQMYYIRLLEYYYYFGCFDTTESKTIQKEISNIIENFQLYNQCTMENIIIGFDILYKDFRFKCQ